VVLNLKTFELLMLNLIMNIMKSLFKVSSLVLGVILLTTGVSFAQKKAKPFNGVITYEITYLGEIDEESKAQLANQSTLSISGNKARSEQVSPFYTVAQIIDVAKGDMIVLIDAMGMKIAVKQTKEEIEKRKAEAETKDPEITYLDETKIIAGVKCKKAEVKVEDQIIDVYYTEELNVPEGINEVQGFTGLKGVLMEYTIEQQGIEMKFSAKEISYKKPKAVLFVIPDDYQIKKPEELGGLFGM